MQIDVAQMQRHIYSNMAIILCEDWAPIEEQLAGRLDDTIFALFRLLEDTS